LKLKEISYIQAEGFAGGELKHGTIALIEEGTPVIALATQAPVNLSIRGNVKEVVARGAYPCIISMEGIEQEGDAFVLPEVNPMLMFENHSWLPLALAHLSQLLARSIPSFLFLSACFRLLNTSFTHMYLDLYFDARLLLLL